MLASNASNDFVMKLGFEKLRELREEGEDYCCNLLSFISSEE
jgi:hypothetical protein